MLVLASVVTKALLSEFELLYSSVRLHEETRIKWCVRADRPTCEYLKKYEDVCTTPFTNVLPTRPGHLTPEFRSIVGEKMNAMEDAWKMEETSAVAFLDADLIFTGSLLLNVADRLECADLVISRNHYPAKMHHLEQQHGIYNSGFIATRRADFHGWWRHAFISQPDRFTDQACLNEVGESFVVAVCDPDVNVGFWRSVEPGFGWNFKAIPSTCKSLHVHMFQPVRESLELASKGFALHSLEFLHHSGIASHKLLLDKIVELDTSRFYRYVLDNYLDGAAPESCVEKVLKAFRAHELPSSILRGFDSTIIEES